MTAIMKVLLRSVIRLLVLSDKRSFSWNAMCIQVRAIIDFFYWACSDSFDNS